jgi:RNase P subunit RPR2
MQKKIEVLKLGSKKVIIKLCPRCQAALNPQDAKNALSRKDNKTIICADCGTAEALEEMLGGLGL